MEFQSSRLRSGEVIAGAAGLVLLVLMFAAPWYGLSGRIGRVSAALGAADSVDAWNGLSALRWLMLVTLGAALALTYFQAARRAPALPVSLSVIVTALGALTVLSLIYRVLINVPGRDDVVQAQAGAYLGLLATIALTAGAFRSLREEDRADPARNTSIPTVELGRRL